MWQLYLPEVTVAVDVLLLVAVLQLVVLDVEPQSLHDAGPCLRVNAQQTGQPWVQLVLGWLVRGRGLEVQTVLVNDSWPGRAQVQAQDPGGPYLVIEHEQKGAFDIDVAGPLNLETIRLLSGGHPVPLESQRRECSIISSAAGTLAALSQRLSTACQIICHFKCVDRHSSPK